MQPPPEEVYASIWQDVFMKPASIGPGREKGHAVSLRWHFGRPLDDLPPVGRVSEPRLGPRISQTVKLRTEYRDIYPRHRQVPIECSRGFPVATQRCLHPRGKAGHGRAPISHLTVAPSAFRTSHRRYGGRFTRRCASFSCRENSTADSRFGRRLTLSISSLTSFVQITSYHSVTVSLRGSPDL